MATLSKLDPPVSESQLSKVHNLEMKVIETICAGGACDPGMVRESNEDRCFFRSFTFTGELGQEHGLVAMVADGMGGHAAGEAASERAVQILASRFVRIQTSEQSRQISPDWPTVIRDAFIQANQEVYEESQRWAGKSGMGTTLTCVVVACDVLYIGHVGDSRAYLIRNGKMLQLTQDHTWVAQQVREGRMTEQEAKTSDKRGQLTNVIGHSKETQPDVDAIGLKPGDKIVLCTDGISEMLSPTDLMMLACSSTDTHRSAASLITAANQAGGHDNSAAVVIDCQSDTVPQIKLPKVPRKPRKWAIIALAAVLVLILADAAYLASRVRNEPPNGGLAPQMIRRRATPDASREDNTLIDLSGRKVEVGPR